MPRCRATGARFAGPVGRPVASRVGVMNNPEAPIHAVIDTAAITHNFALLARKAAGQRVMAIVKADAYGHGVRIVAPALAAAGADFFGVATIPEALALDELLHAAPTTAPAVAGPMDAEVVAPGQPARPTILCWLYPPGDDLAELIRRGIHIGVGSPVALDSLHAATRATGKKAQVHLKVDTGLGRNGLTRSQLQLVCEQLATAPDVEVTGVMSHYACADEPTHPFNATQTTRFTTAVDYVKQTLGCENLFEHIANSPAILSMDPIPGNTVRAGVALYGLSPFGPGNTHFAAGLTPAQTLISTVCAVKDVPAGQGASYGLRYTTSAPSRFALVAGGYGDGIPRQASHKAHVNIGGVEYPVVGTIAMDQMIVDVGDARVSVGDPAVVWGAGGPSVDAWARWAGTINYDIVTRLGARVPRVEGGPVSPSGLAGPGAAEPASAAATEQVVPHE